MTVTDIAGDVQSQLFSAAQTVQDTVLNTLEWLTEQAQTAFPEAASRIAVRLPQAAQYVDQGFETAEQWLRSQHEFANRLTGLAPQPTTTA